MDTPEETLPLADYRRYGRQMVLDGFGLPAQLRLQKSSVLVVGAGGLGCPALQYLCAAGVGRIGIVDADTVELSNLQRQILHSEDTIGKPKVDSASSSLKLLNSHSKLETYEFALDATNAESTVCDYDIVLDCSDNAATRYLISDTAVRHAKPLVSGAAQKFDGQLCTYNLPLDEAGSERGPCYRCLFPKPPAPEMAGSCEELGILGAVTGVIGTLQALEAIKIITGLHDRKPTMLIYSALAFPPFRSIKLRTHRKTCPACGEEAEKIGSISDLDYVTFCGGPKPDWVRNGLKTGEKRRCITAKELNGLISDGNKPIRIVDVRSSIEFGICHLPSSINIPLPSIVANPSTSLPDQDGILTVLVCRLGNDSQIASDAINSIGGVDSKISDGVVDLVGGLRSWATDVDGQFPVY